MTTPWSQDYAWAFYTAACILWLIAGVGLYIALFRDRSRGRRRCPKCWYDMAGVTGLKCPECGREARKERRLHTTRRRWRLATLFALLAALGIASFRGPHTFRHGFFAAVPIPILNFVLSWFPEDAKAAYLLCRTRQGTPPPWPPVTTWDELLASWYAAETVDGSGEDVIRFLVIGSAGHNGRPGIRALRGTAGGVGDVAIPALGSMIKLDVAEAREVLEQITLNHEDEWTRSRAIAALCQHTRGRHLQNRFLRACLAQSTDQSIRELAATELAWDSQFSKSEILSLMREGEEGIKAAIVKGLTYSKRDYSWLMPEMLRLVCSDPESGLTWVILDQLASSTPLESHWNDVLLSYLRRRTAPAADSPPFTGNESLLVVASLKACASLRDPHLTFSLVEAIVQLRQDPRPEIATAATILTLRRPESFSTQELNDAWEVAIRQNHYEMTTLTQTWATAILHRFIDGDPGPLRPIAINRILERISTEPSTIPLALNWLANDQDPVLRTLSASSLGQSTSEDRSITLALIEAARRDESSAVRAVALRAAETRRDADTQLVAALIEALNDPSPQVVLAAANSLARLGPRAAAAHDALTAAADHPDASARSAIADAITKTRAN
jgi:hypothetical protein